MSENAVLTLEQVAEKLQLSPAWLYRKCKSGVLPHIRIGKVIRFREKDLDDWLSSNFNKGKTKNELAV